MSNNKKVSKSNPVLKKYQDKIEDIGEIFKKEPVNFLMANALLHLNEEQLIELRDKLISRTPKDKEIIDDEFIAKQYSNSILYQLEKWIDENITWQPSTNDVRRKILDEEKKHINKFMIADLPGYAHISISDSKEEVMLHFYNGLSEAPYESISLTELQGSKK